MLVDKKFRLVRIWSNKELHKFAHLFSGDIINVSGWKDIDKEGKKYEDYFINANSYTISNFESDMKGYQGFESEIYLDLTKELNKDLVRKFDVVFNHTTLEHIYDIKLAFKNLCLLSKDILIVVIPFLQQMHGNYDDYWRFTPLAIKKLFEENNFTLLYLNFNNHKKSSVYIFAIGSSQPEKWNDKIRNEFTYKCKNYKFDDYNNFIGCRSIKNSFAFRLLRKLKLL